MPRSAPREKKAAMAGNIVFWRRFRSLSQIELAERCGWQSGRISKYETASSWPDDESVERLARELEIPRSALYDGMELLVRHLVEILGPREGVSVEYPAAGAPVAEVREPVEGVPAELARAWEDLRRGEAALRAERDRLTLETQAVLLRAAMERDGSGED